MLYNYVTLKLNKSLVLLKLEIILNRHNINCRVVAVENEFVVIKTILNEYVRELILTLKMIYNIESTICGCYISSEYLGVSKEN